MGVLLSSGYRCRHVVFTAAAPRRPLNLSRACPASLANDLPPADAADPTDEDTFVSWLFSRAGLDARVYRRASLRRRVPACLRALRARTIADARRLVHWNPGLVPTGIGALLIGVTSFFRDAPVFNAISAHLLPAIARSGRRLRVWSAACSGGAELYSIAMLLAEMKVLHRCELLGTDCRGQAVAAAASATYDAGECRALPAELRHRYLEPVGRDGQLRVRPWLREAVAWHAADVLERPEAGPWDLILCRNMAMYLRPAAADRLWRGLARELRPGGLLVVGKAERPAGIVELAPAAPCVYRRGGVA